MLNYMFFVRFLYILFIPIICLMLIISGRVELDLIIICWLLNLIFALVFDKTKRMFVLIWSFFTLYNISSYLVFKYSEVIYPPFPSPEDIVAGTVLSLKCTFIGFIISSCLLFKFNWDKWIKENVIEIKEKTKDISLLGVLLCCIFLIVPGALDFLTEYKIGITQIISSGRRFYAPDLLSTSNNIVQLIAISSTIVLIYYFLNDKRRSIYKLIYVPVILIIYWGPFLLAGSRKEFLFVIIIAFIYLIYGKKVSKKVYALFVSIFILLFLLPAILSKDIFYSLHEFVLPQYFLFSIMNKNVVIDYSYLKGMWLLLPKFLRISHVTDIGTAFADTHLTTVGVGSHPIAEAYLNASGNEFLTITFFSIVTVLLFIYIIFLSKKNPFYSFLGLAHLIVWGRSDLWVTVFFLTYGGLLINILTVKKKTIFCVQKNSSNSSKKIRNVYYDNLY